MKTAIAKHMQWRQRMRSTCDGDSACGAHAMESAHAEHMRWRQRMLSTVETAHAEHGGARWIKHMLSTVETAHAEHGGDSACGARWRHAEPM